MSAKRTLWSGITSYLALGSSMITGLLLIRLATRNLSPDEMGLWAFCFGTVGYFLLMDFGVTNSLGRLFADAVANRDHKEMSGWLYLSIAVLGLQGILVLSAGLLARDPILHWFKIPENLSGEAKALWTWLVCIQAVAMPLRALPGFRYAQNRVYHNHLFGIASTWINLGIFWWLLGRGNGVLSYAYASAGSTFVTQLGFLISVFTGKDRLKLCQVPLPFAKLPELFRYSSAILVQSLATQCAGATQSMILTRILGLDAVAIYSVTSRLPAMFAQLISKPFDACVPRWIHGYCSGDFRKSRDELVIVLRFTILASLAGVGVGILLNAAFVNWWTRPEFFGGVILTGLICLATVTGTLQHCMGFAFHLSKRMGMYTLVLLGGFVIEAGSGILIVRHYGIIGIPLASLTASFTLVLWFLATAGGKTYGIHVWNTLWKDILLGVAVIALCAGATWWISPQISATGLERILYLGPLAGILVIPLGWRCFALGRRWLASRRGPKLSEAPVLSNR